MPAEPVIFFTETLPAIFYRIILLCCLFGSVSIETHQISEANYAFVPIAAVSATVTSFVFEPTSVYESS